MNFAKVEKCDVVNGTGIRVSLFVSGCRNNCKGCYNKIAQDFKFGNKFTDQIMLEILEYLSNEYVSGLSILGGEPMDEKNVEEVANIVSIVRHRLPTKNIWLWSGYTLEQLQSRECASTNYILSNIDVLVDGPFVEALKDPTLKFRGSSNQRILQQGIDF